MNANNHHTIEHPRSTEANLMAKEPRNLSTFSQGQQRSGLDFAHSSSTTAGTLRAQSHALGFGLKQHPIETSSQPAF